MVKNWNDGPVVTTDLVSHLLTRRHIDNIDRFMQPRFPDDLYDPAQLKDCDSAADRFWSAVNKQESIAVIGDYDMDGTPAAALLFLFASLVTKPPLVILPTRQEGYGFSDDFVDRCVEAKCSLIITVDCGIRSHETVAYAKSKGIDVIITDHHECGSTLPQALAVINPKRGDSAYPFRELSGTGVVYKFITMLIKTAPVDKKDSIPANWLPWSLDLVALATIGDMVPLIDENRVFVHYGLKVLQKTRRLGLQRLYRALELNPEKLTYTDIAFKIIPKCNASGRMESMDDVLTLLTSQDTAIIDRVIKRIMARSTQSQLILTQMLEQARTQPPETNQSIILLHGDDWHPGLTGLVAGRLSEEWNRPVGALARISDTHYRGSLRAARGVHLPEILENAAHLIEMYGGHEQAAGLTVKQDQLAPLKSHFDAVPLPDPRESLFETDGTLPVEMISLNLVEQLETLSPWGVGNEEPLWSLTGIPIARSQWLSDGRHLKAWLGGPLSQISVIFFGADVKHPPTEGLVDVYGTLSINEFRDKKEPQMILKGMSSHGAIQIV